MIVSTGHTKYMLALASLLVLIRSAEAQLSPGDLVQAHAHLEGLSNCTKCHEIGQKVTNAKCLDCHDIIDKLIDAGRGYHVSEDVHGKDCFTCHSDHHGRRFEIVRFDVDRFDHDLTGYSLTGAHRQLECAQCHNAGFIADTELKERSGTYLGLETSCISCHDDYHQGTLGSSCIACHDTDAFRPASGFSHAESAFPLRGAHTGVECASCHSIDVRNGKEFQEFNGLNFNQCSSCHDDPHSSRFGADCRSCHVEESFLILRGQGAFNHNTTGFPLRGQHKTIDCADCHDLGKSREQAFMDFVNADTENCASCHTDVHQGKFGVDCRSCHTEQSFQQIRGGLEQVNHDLTAFPLEGRHAVVDCRACHVENLTAPIAFRMCTDCHKDYHEGQLNNGNNVTRDCAECHSVDRFASSSFSIDQHNETGFALEGAHIATPCFACHLQEEEWEFRDIGHTCVHCHVDVHAGELALEFYNGADCAKCHVSESWSIVSFDHSLTDWTLQGAHASVQCSKCHRNNAGEGPAFSGLSTECSACHEQVHRSQFATNGTTDCLRCHIHDYWRPSVFDHDSARFVLEGAHVNVDCAGCHTTVNDQDGAYVLYTLDKLDCVDCHQ